MKYLNCKNMSLSALIRIKKIAPAGEIGNCLSIYHDLEQFKDRWLCVRDWGHSGPHAAYGMSTFPRAVWMEDDEPN